MIFEVILGHWSFLVAQKLFILFGQDDFILLLKISEIIPVVKNDVDRNHQAFKFLTGNIFTLTTLTHDNLDNPGKYLNLLCLIRY